MQAYIGTKQVNAKPMTRQAYNDFRGWELPADENGADDGYLVEYVDSPNANTAEYAGYVSWSPKEQFDKAHQQTTDMNFGHALEFLKQGKRVARKGWNGKGMWLGFVEDTYAINFGDEDGDLKEYENHPYIVMKTVEDKIVPWLASQTDMLAEDWEVVGD